MTEIYEIFSRQSDQDCLPAGTSRPAWPAQEGTEHRNEGQLSVLASPCGAQIRRLSDPIYEILIATSGY